MKYFPVFCLLLISACAVRRSVPAPEELSGTTSFQPPVFPDQSFSIQDEGALPDGRTDARPAIQAAIDRCHASGGGKVVAPPGVYFCDGPLHLKSKVNLHLEKGSVIRFGVRPESYTPLVKVRWEGTVCYNYSPLIYAYRQRELAITGYGVIDGQAHLFWYAWKRGNEGKNQEQDKPLLRQMGNDKVPEEQRIFGGGYFDVNGDGRNDGDAKPHYLRPSLVEFFECESILLDGFEAKGSPFWTIHPVFCKRVTITNLRIGKGTSNDDGIDPDSCEDVLIENCKIDTNDDPIAIKAGRDQDAWNRPGSRRIVVRNCIVSTEVGNGFCIGSEMSGGVEQVYVEDYYIKRADNGINFKANLDRGGFIREVYIRNIRVDSCNKNGILFQMDYHGFRGGNFPPDFQRVFLRNIHIGNTGKAGIRIAGVESKPIVNIHLNNVEVKQAGNPMECRFVEGLFLKRVRLNGMIWKDSGQKQVD